MKVEFKTDILVDLVNKAYKGVGNNKLIPITSLIGLQFAEDGFYVRSYDGLNEVVIKDSSIKRDYDLNHEEVVVNANILKALLDKITTDKIYLELDTNRLIITGNGEYILDIVYDEDIPLTMKRLPFDDFNCETYTIKKNDLLVAITSNEASVDLNNQIVCETGALFSKKLITTDEILATLTNVELVKDKKFLFSYSTLHLVDIFNKDELIFKVNGNSFKLTDGVNYIVGNFVQGVDEYPEESLLSLFGDDLSCVGVKTQELVNALNRLSIFVKAFDRDDLNLILEKNTLTLKTNLSNAVETLKVTGDAPDYKEFNVSLTKFLSQLSHIEDEEILLRYNSGAFIRFDTTNSIYLIAEVEK